MPTRRSQRFPSRVVPTVRRSARLASLKQPEQLSGKSANSDVPQKNKDYDPSDLIDEKYLAYETTVSGTEEPVIRFLDVHQNFSFTLERKTWITPDKAIGLYAGKDEAGGSPICFIVKQEVRNGKEELAEASLIHSLREAKKQEQKDQSLERACGSIVPIYPVFEQSTAVSSEGKPKVIWQRHKKKVVMPRMLGDMENCSKLMYLSEEKFESLKEKLKEDSEACGEDSKTFDQQMQMFRDPEEHTRILVSGVTGVCDVGEAVVCLQKNLGLHYFDLKPENIFMELVSDHENATPSEESVQFRLGDLGSLKDPVFTYVSPWLLSVNHSIIGEFFEGNDQYSVNNEHVHIQYYNPTRDYQERFEDCFEDYVYFVLALTICQFLSKTSFSPPDQLDYGVWLHHNFSDITQRNAGSVAANVELLEIYQQDVQQLREWISKSATEEGNEVLEAAFKARPGAKEKFLKGLEAGKEQLGKVILYLRSLEAESR